MPTITRGELLNLLDSGLSEDEAKDLAFELGRPWEDLPGDTKRARLRELIALYERDHRVDELISLFAKHYPRRVAPSTTYEYTTGTASPEALIVARPTLPCIGVDFSHGQGKLTRYPEALAVFKDGNKDTAFQNITGGITAEALRTCSALIMAIPLHCTITDTEVAAIQEWVEQGNGLLLLGYYTADTHHQSNLNRLARVFDVEFAEDIVMPPDYWNTRGHVLSSENSRYWVTLECQGDHPILDGVTRVVFVSACSLQNLAMGKEELKLVQETGEVAIVRAVGHKDEDGYMRDIDHYHLECRRPTPMLAAWTKGVGRVVALGTWKFVLPIYPNHDNPRLLTNILKWLSEPGE